ncbi:FAD-dependent oxidoreductase [Desulfonema magnum]|uniref:4Fe-4S dicluster domain-containing protein n=1 Tax=Desulfonema magnum TaxID=45655 RepID=A0A975GP77_9BACT|nr:FAD-dependent oxidoreductase [Desulfonema magnum]QTA87628.1 4Fe-4S dicluster domain-containing protein [Desulfonema magnum]
MAKKSGSVMVVGAGVAGMQASLDLANSDYNVYLVDKSPTIGGMMSRLPCIGFRGVECQRNMSADNGAAPRSEDSFPTNDCAMCMFSHRLNDVGGHKNINVITTSEIRNIEGELGNFDVTLVDYSDDEKESKVQVGSVILSSGSQTFDPSALDFLGYQYPNVVTGEEFERLINESEPGTGRLMRPSDKQEPKKIAWMQCVGSRDINRGGNGYCSSVCCLYAIKEVSLVKERMGADLDCAVFNMDIRTFGKDYEKFYNNVRCQDGVRFMKARIHTISEDPETGDLNVRYMDEAGTVLDETFSMVVLSTGLEIPKASVELANRLGIELNHYNFVKTDPFQPVQSSRPGIYICGLFQGPKDIPESVTEASAAACLAGTDIVESRGDDLEKVEFPEEIDVSGQEPRIGVFVCNCGVNIGGVVDVNSVQEYASTLPNVVFTDSNLFTCSDETRDRIKEMIIEHKLNRVVVASCTLENRGEMFMETLASCGLNKYLLEMANIRNQAAWVHANAPDMATQKAKDIVRMSVARAANLNPLQEKIIPVSKHALIIGGGIAGMNAALSLGKQGFDVVLLEKDAQLGGFARKLHHTIEGKDIRAYVEELVSEVNANDKIQVMTEARIIGSKGFQGNFVTQVAVGSGDDMHNIEHGVTIVATGASEYQPKEFLYGEDERVLTQVELSDRLEEKGASDIESVVMIQCVGSRNEEHENCSRICCQSAVKNAIHIKKLNPDARVYVLYRDIRTYGLLEDYYTEARRRGVIFIRFDRETPPELKKTSEGLVVKIKDPVLQRELEISTDLVTLSAGVVANDTAEISRIMKLDRDSEGFFTEAHIKLRPVDMLNEGIFVCGTAHGPKLISESIAQAQAAASRATTFLAKDVIRLSAVTAKVDTDHCVKCLTCVRSCPFDVPVFNEEENCIEISETLCQGCGICASVCPRQTIQLSFYEDNQVTCKIDALLAG